MFISLLKHWSQLYWGVRAKQNNNAMRGSLTTNRRLNLLLFYYLFLLCHPMKSHKGLSLIPVVTREYLVNGKLCVFVLQIFMENPDFYERLYTVCSSVVVWRQHWKALCLELCYCRFRILSGAYSLKWRYMEQRTARAPGGLIKLFDQRYWGLS